MRRIFASALLASAFHVSAWADPLQLTPDTFAASPSVNAAAASQPGAVDVGRQRYAAANQQPYADANQANMGGGFIEFLFGGAARPPSVPRAYQPAMPEYQTDPAALPDTMRNDPAQGYAPSGDGDMAHAPPDPKFNRQVVEYTGKEAPGTIIIDTPNRFLFLVEEGGKAMRYGIGVGRPGFTWAGVKTITAKREWPDWRPPDDMLKRRPDLPRYMAGGPENPLGARAMYLGSTLYRIHGSNEPWTIGTNVSSGCIRMRNEDVTDLYGRVKVGTKVVVI
jgi:lipoprotein-anchoring transpeptidase ErfK/SrfK